MTDLATKAAEAASKLNPASERQDVSERKRIPMSLPQMSLAVPDLPGYYLYWMLGTPQRIQQALNAGYRHVTNEEIQLNNFDLGGDALKTGNTDMGDYVSVLASTGSGNYVEGGQALRLYLMKQKWEHHQEDLGLLEARNDRIADQLTSSFVKGQVGGVAPGETSADFSLRRVDPKRSAIPDLFKRKPKRS